MASPELLETLGDFTSKENWDKFFGLRGADVPFEWYAEWPSLRESLLSELSLISTTTTTTTTTPPPPLQILIPGCGSSRLSEHLYDAGYRSITNVDFSKVIISDMLRRNVRRRPEMRWRIMDMTQMQLADESFDAVVDKGGLDALMEPKLGSELGSKYLKEVKRILKSGGKYLCLTLAESHILGLLLSTFRFGWKMHIYAVMPNARKSSTFETFMVVIAKENSGELSSIVSSLDHLTLNSKTNQAHALLQAIESENKTRSEISAGADILYSLEDLQLGAKGKLKDLLPGCRCQLILGDQGDSRFGYKAVLLDSRQQSDTFSYHCGAFIVPKARAHEWLFCSEEGQWLVVEGSKAARLIMIFLDSRHDHASMGDIQKDLSPLVKKLAPEIPDSEAPIPFMMANDGVKERNIIKQVTSTTTGPIIVEDVIYENVEDDGSSLIPPEAMIFRRLTFERSLGLVQSEALLNREEHAQHNRGGTEKNKSNLSAKSRKKGCQRRSDSRMPFNGSRTNLKVDHSYLASSYHSGIISGFILIASALKVAASSGRKVRTTIIGLGAGLLPMCLHECLPFLDIEVVELDPVILDLARDYFGFTEDKQLKVHISDGIQFVQEEDAVKSSSELDIKHDRIPSGKQSAGIKILIVDADSSDMSSGLTCPPADFLEESFLLCVKDFLSEGGLFVINLVSRSPAIREMAILRMKAVFHHLFCLELEEDVNKVLFAIPTESCIDLENFSGVAVLLEELLHFTQQERGQKIIETTKRIKCLK